MIEHVAQLRTSIPSVFSALGIGAIFTIASWLLASNAHHNNLVTETIPLATNVYDAWLPESSKTFVASFVFVFLTYTIGISIIGLSSRYRQSFFRQSDPALVKKIAGCNNEFVQAEFIEKRKLIAILDGMGLAIFYLVGVVAFLAYFELGWKIGSPMVLLAFSSCWLFWRESSIRSANLVALVDEYSGSTQNDMK